MLQAAVEVSQLSRRFKTGRQALSEISLTVQPGEMVALIGASGSGKSTLLRHIAGLAPVDRGTQGIIRVAGQSVLADGRMARDVRRVRAGIGFVFQQFNLVDRLSVLKNVLIGHLGRVPLWRSLFHGFTDLERAAALRALARVGIAECAYQRASTLSGGQQQRAAIARALTQGADLILADEPIASLDPESSRRVMEILAEINRVDRKTVIVCLHQVDFALEYCPRVVALKAGKVVYDGAARGLKPADLTDLYGGSAADQHTPDKSRPRALDLEAAAATA